MSVIVTTIVSRGKEMDPSYGLLSIEVSKEVNRLPSAILRLADGDTATGKFEVSDASFFAPGNEIEIKLGYAGEGETTVFKGIVVRHGIESDRRRSCLTVELKDQATKLAYGRKSVIFRDQSDDEVIGKILQDAGIEAGERVSTQPKHAELVQFYATDWDFILSRADVQGLVVTVDDGKVSLHKMEVSGAHAHALEYGIDNIESLDIELDGIGQYSDIESVAWDLKELKATSPSQAKPSNLPQGNTDGGDLARQTGSGTYLLSHPVPLDPQELQAWADARMARSRLALIRGRLTVPGIGAIKPMDIIKLDGVGQRFSGKTLVTGVQHHVEDGVWKTEIRFGLEPDWFCHQERIAEVPAAGLLPPVSGLQIGIVDEFEDDPDQEYRVKVILSAIGESRGAVWARLAAPDAGKDRGYFFRPEAGDEVVVGFFDSDPRQPVILGAMYGSKNEPPSFVAKLSKDNVNKGLISKKGTIIGFVDEDEASVFIETANENRILLDDDGERIEISDQHGNAITLDENGITLESAKDFKIKARGKVDIESSQPMKLDAPKIDVK